MVIWRAHRWRLFWLHLTVHVNACGVCCCCSSSESIAIALPSIVHPFMWITINRFLLNVACCSLFNAQTILLKSRHTTNRTCSLAAEKKHRRNEIGKSNTDFDIDSRKADKIKMKRATCLFKWIFDFIQQTVWMRLELKTN